MHVRHWMLAYPVHVDIVPKIHLLNVKCFTCNSAIFAAGLYTMFTTVLILLRKNEMVSDTGDLPPLTYRAREISTGWSVYVGWLAFLLSAVAGALWIALSKELKKTCAVFMYNSKYDQICSM